MRGDTFRILQGVLRARDMTYADLGARLDLSEPTVKRIFAGKDCKLSRLTQICDVLDVSLSDVIDRADRAREDTITLSPETEATLARDPQAFFFFLLLRDLLPQDTIARRFRITPDTVFQIGRTLERLGLTETGAGGKIRLLSTAPLQFRVDGPLLTLLRELNLRFLSSIITRPADATTQFFTISRRMLPETAADITRQISALHQEIAELARQDQLTVRDDDLVTYKLTGGWGAVDFPDLLKSVMQQNTPA